VKTYLTKSKCEPYRRTVMMAGLLITTAVCCGSTSATAADAEELVIVAFGDSTTAARGELKIYADTLEKELAEHGLPVRVINAGIGGNHTDHARARFEKDVLSHDPDTVIIQFGINDAAVDVWKDPPATEPRVPLEKYENNLRHFIHVLAKRDVSVVLMTPNPLRWTQKMREMYGKPPYLPHEKDGFNIILRTYAEKVRQIATTENIPLIDVYRTFEETEGKGGRSVAELLLDGIHPNAPGHRLLADRLIALLLRTGKSGGHASAATIQWKITDNPATSSLSDPESGVTQIRFEDYVSNPPPQQRNPLQGWVGQFSIPFMGLVKPLATNTTVAPLPTPIGLLIESSADRVGFYDPSSLVDCADARADKLIFRFVDPGNTNRAATVSRVAFRVTGTSVLNGKVRYSVHDVAGRMLA
jgi:lysophospholipase L1-like esterase